VVRPMIKQRIDPWQLLKWALQACALICLAAWFILLGTICSSPQSPDTANSITYSCHGSIVYITEFQHLLLTWLIPVLFVVGFIGVAVNKRFKVRPPGESTTRGQTGPTPLTDNPNKRRLAKCFFWSTPLLIVLSMYLQSRFASTRPLIPQPEEGRIYEFHYHASTVYLTNLEYFAAQYLFWIAVLFGVIGGALFQSLRSARTNY
jgi:hypothetical protein